MFHLHQFSCLHRVAAGQRVSSSTVRFFKDFNFNCKFNVSRVSSSLCRQSHTSIPLPATGGGGGHGEHSGVTQLQGGNTEDGSTPSTSSPYLASITAQHPHHHSFPQNHTGTTSGHKKSVASNSGAYHCPDKVRGLISGHGGLSLNGNMK